MITSQNLPLKLALKEWAIALDALYQGEQILLLRKGGIREQGRGFTLEAEAFGLYPTYEHQKPELLKPAYAHRVEPVPSGWHPAQVTIRAWAAVTEKLELDRAEQIEALLPLHVWNERFVRDRLRWQPKMPLSLLLLRVYHLATPQILDYCPAFGGCRSWLELPKAITVENSHPVLSDEGYGSQVAHLKTLVGVGPIHP